MKLTLGEILRSNANPRSKYIFNNAAGLFNNFAKDIFVGLAKNPEAETFTYDLKYSNDTGEQPDFFEETWTEVQERFFEMVEKWATEEEVIVTCHSGYSKNMHFSIRARMVRLAKRQTEFKSLIIID